MGGRGEDSRSSVCKSRWLCVTRSAVALVVTVVAAVVVARGLLLVLHPGNMEINISQSNVFVTRYGVTNHTYYGFRFYLEATNPSDLVFLYYRNITVQLLDTTVQPPSNKLLAEFNLNPSSLSLSQKEEQEYFVYGYARNVTDIAVQKLFKDEKEAEIGSAVMVLSGIVAVENIKQSKTARFAATFNCEPVAVKSYARLPEPSSKNYKADCLQA